MVLGAQHLGAWPFFVEFARAGSAGDAFDGCAGLDRAKNKSPDQPLNEDAGITL